MVIADCPNPTALLPSSRSPILTQYRDPLRNAAVRHRAASPGHLVLPLLHPAGPAHHPPLAALVRCESVGERRTSWPAFGPVLAHPCLPMCAYCMPMPHAILRPAPWSGSQCHHVPSHLTFLVKYCWLPYPPRPGDFLRWIHALFFQIRAFWCLTRPLSLFDICFKRRTFDGLV